MRGHAELTAHRAALGVEGVGRQEARPSRGAFLCARRARHTRSKREGAARDPFLGSLRAPAPVGAGACDGFRCRPGPAAQDSESPALYGASLRLAQQTSHTLRCAVLLVGRPAEAAEAARSMSWSLCALGARRLGKRRQRYELSDRACTGPWRVRGTEPSPRARAFAARLLSRRSSTAVRAIVRRRLCVSRYCRALITKSLVRSLENE